MSCCQRLCLLGRHALGERIFGRLQGALGIGGGLRRALARSRERLGGPSRFPPGGWVRVRSQDEIRATLDGRGRLRGLAFAPEQWTTCGKVFAVRQEVRRILDDRGRMRPVSGTVLLESVTCAGRSGTGGCGRHCPLMYREEWLEPADAPRLAPPPADVVGTFVTIRAAADLDASVNLFRRRDGLMLTPEMRRLAGTRARVLRQLPQVFECDRWTPTPRPIYLLEGLSCSGEVLGADGPCHRRCPLLWHADWLRFD